MGQPQPAASARDPLDFADRLVPGMIDVDLARRTVRVSSLLAAAASFSFVPLYLAFGPSEFVVPNTGAAIALVVVAFAPFRSWSHRMYTAVTIGLALLATQLFLLGRVDTASSVWFLVPPLAAMLVGARRMAAYSAFVAIAVTVIVVVAREFGWPIVGDVVLPRPDLVMALSIVGAIITTGAAADVTLRTRRALMADVEATTIDLAGALQEARAARVEAVAAAEAKDRFFANLTHEIRTPLNGIAGTAELLSRSDLSADQRPLADALATSTRNLVVLVNAMLDHARLQAGHVTVDRAPLDTRRAAREIEDLFRAQAAGKGLALTVTVDDAVPAWVSTDPIKVRQLLANLVANAVKFTATGWVRVTVDYVPPDIGGTEARVVVRIADSGAGIPPDQVDAIFEPFVQGDASISRRHGGTGLGLAIARQLAELLGARLTVASEPGSGSVFTLDLPVGAAEAPADEPFVAVPCPAAGAGDVRVLLAEDNEINRIVATRMLQRLDAEVLVATDGARAVEIATGEAIDLVLMDLQMPGMDGIEATRVIRRIERERGVTGVPIVAMTGNDPGDYGEECAAAGMDGFLMKPVSLGELGDLLARVRSAV